MQPPHPAETQHNPLSEAERAAIREQLERILLSPLFKNSKRYPNLLRYIVEHTLEGHKAELKERTLGVEVFARSPGYDTNADPIVRAAAGEIRKRIAQYYHEPGHESELRIDLVPGSYVPEFGMPAPTPAPRQPVPEPPRPQHLAGGSGCAMPWRFSLLALLPSGSSGLNRGCAAMPWIGSGLLSWTPPVRC